MFTEQQISKAARVLADRNAAICNVNKDDNWAIYGNDFIEDVRAIVAAISPLSAQPAVQVPQDTILAKKDIEYPRDVFSELISGNSPYAFYLFQWVPYQTEAKRWRLKLSHDVRTFDGREAHGIWPNGDRCGPFKDDEVEFIRISRVQYGEVWKDSRPASAGAGGKEGE